MFINEENKLIYLVKPKTASSALRKELLKHNFKSYDDIIQKVKGNNTHSTMKQIIEYLVITNKDPSSYIYFTLVRDPIDTIVSNFLYCKFDKYWNAFYSERSDALINYNYDNYEYKYYGKYGYSINDYIETGYNLSMNLCTHPLSLTKFTEILSNK